MIYIESKICRECGQDKSLLDFYPNKQNKDGVGSYCKQCNGLKVYGWIFKNKNKRKRHRKDYYLKNKDEILLNRGNYYEKNKGKSIKNSIEYFRLKYINDPIFRLNHNISGQMRKSLLKNKNGYHWEQLVGYTLKDLKKHLEKQFVNGMDWGNYGQWHIDHIIPVSVFNFRNSKDINFKYCWELKNLRPMWARENLSKHNKLYEPFQPSLNLSC